MKSNRTRRLFSAVVVAIVCCVAIAWTVLYLTPPTTASTNAGVSEGTQTVSTPHTYDMPPESTRQVAGAVGATVLGWKVVGSDAATGTIHLRAPARFGLAHDEVTATISPSGKNAAVEIVSQAHYRGLDFGANVRHIRDLQAAMDKQLPAAR